MSTIEQINAYLAWRSEREGKTVDVSPEAYERDRLLAMIIENINDWQMGPMPGRPESSVLATLGMLVQELNELEDN